MPSPNANARLFTLGRLALEDAEGGTLASAKFAKPLGVLAYLALAPGRQASRDRLVDLFWSHQTTDKARGALRQTLHRIRAMDPGILLDHGNDLVALAPGVWADCTAFLEALADGRNADAITLYGGPFVADIISAGSASFEHWADRQRDLLQEHFLDAVEIAARHDLDTGNHRVAHQLALRALDFEPVDQRLWRVRLEAESRLFAPSRLAISISELRQLLTETGAELEPRTLELIGHLDDGDRTERPGYDPVVHGELVGRSDQFTVLFRGWQRAGTAHTTCLHISAPPGLGKTRLLSDFGIRLAADRIRVVPVRATPRQRELPWSAAADLANRLAALSGAPGISGSSADILVDLAPGLGGRFPAASPRLIADREERRRARREALHDLLTNVLHEGPVVLLLDDLHWWDPESLDATATLVERTPDAALLVVTASRPPGAGFGQDTFSLEPLTEQDVEGLLTSLQSSGDPLPAGLVENLWQATDGSPLLVVEAIRLAMSDGSVKQDDGLLSFHGATEFFGTLKAGSILQHRVTQLPPEQRRIARLAATLSTAIRPEEVEHIDAAACHALERGGLLAPAPGGLTIAHDRLADVLLESMTAAEQEMVHRDAAHVLRLQGDLPGVARHLAETDQRPELRAVALEWVQQQRANGDQRRAGDILSDLLPASAPAMIRDLTTSLPWGIRRPGTARVHVAWGLGALLLAAAAWRAHSDSAPPPVTLQFDALSPRFAGGWWTYRFESFKVTFDANNAGAEPIIEHRQLQLPLGAKAPQNLQDAAPVGSASRSPDGTFAWTIYDHPNDSNGPSTMFIERNGRLQPLAPSRGDEAGLTWSPDGSTIAYQTTSLPDGKGSFDIALLNVATGESTPLVVSEDIEEQLQWGPDGLRLAFLQRPADRSAIRVCWVMRSGGDAHCEATEHRNVIGLLGWPQPRTLYAQIRNRSEQIIRIDPVTGAAETVLELGTFSYLCALDPSGRWLLCPRNQTNATGQAEVQLNLYDLEGPFSQTPLATLPFAQGRPLVFWPDNRPERHAPTLNHAGDTIHAIVGIRSFPAVRTELTQRGDRQALMLPVVWTSADPAIAASEGDAILPVRPGNARIVASISSGATDTLTLHVRPQASKLLHAESWDTGWDARWQVFGTPEPSIIDRDIGRALLVNGDSEFSSGVERMISYSPEDGLAVEALVSTPVDRAWWQWLGLRLQPGVEQFTAATPECGIKVPSEDTDPFGQFENGGVFSEPDMLSGAPWRLRLQILPDGSCAIAINGKARFRSWPMQWGTDSIRIRIEGQSVGTEIVSGPVTIWRGVPPGVDWNTVSPRWGAPRE